MIRATTCDMPLPKAPAPPRRAAGGDFASSVGPPRTAAVDDELPRDSQAGEVQPSTPLSPTPSSDDASTLDVLARIDVYAQPRLATSPVMAPVIPVRNGAVPVVAPVQLQVTVAGAIVDTFDIPWGLSATGHLDWASAPGTPASLRPQAAGEPVAADALSRGSAGPSTHALSSSTPCNADFLRVVESATAARAIGPVAGASEADATESVVASATPVAEWQQRLLRCIGRHEAATVFVRDYRLRHDDAYALTKHLLAALHAQGRSVARIVVNGQTTWNREDARHAD